MSVALTEKQYEWVKKIAKEESINDYDVETSSGSIKGDGYLGIITTIKITDKRGPKVLNLVLKSAITSPEFRKQAPVTLAYEREIYIYEVIFPEFLKFQMEQGITDTFTSHAKCYGTIDKENEEAIFLEDIRKKGFRLWNRQKPMDDSHISLVFREYGKFHGISFAMKKLESEKFEKLTKDLTNVFEKMVPEEILETMVSKVFDDAGKIIKNPDILEATKKFGSEAIDFLKTDINTHENSWVLTHGDSWCNNMMFKYEDADNPEKPTKVCLIDWQISRTASPCMDLAYFLCTCGSQTVLQNYKDYLKIYHNSLSDTIRSYGLNPDDLYPFDCFESEWKKFAKFGFYMSFFIVKLMLMEVDEVPDFEKISEEGKLIFDDFNVKTVNEEAYNQRINYIAEFMFENKFI